MTRTGGELVGAKWSPDSHPTQFAGVQLPASCSLSNACEGPLFDVCIALGDSDAIAPMEAECQLAAEGRGLHVQLLPGGNAARARACVPPRGARVAMLWLHVRNANWLLGRQLQRRDPALAGLFFACATWVRFEVQRRASLAEALQP